MIAALFVETDGPYFGLPDVDPWDITRDARKYSGPWPVVAHPPCSAWCQLAGLVAHRYTHKPKGEDGGCFAAALAAVRRWGGVLEHPAYSAAWRAYGINPPTTGGGWTVADFVGGWTCYVEQHAYGHPARKATWLYACGVSSLPSLRWGRTRGDQCATAIVTWCNNRSGRRTADLPRISKSAAARTPPEFRDTLLNIARSAHGHRV